MEYVFALTDGVSSAPDGAVVTTARGQVWAADDPFVVARQDLFSAEPPTVYNTVGLEQRDVKPLSVRTTSPRKAAKR